MHLTIRTGKRFQPSLLEHGFVTLDQVFEFHNFFGAEVDQWRPDPSGRFPKDLHRGLNDRHFVAFATSAETI